MGEFLMETLIDLNVEPVDEHLFHITALFCPDCSEWRNFYISHNKPFCNCCHEQLTATQEDLKTVDKFLEIYPRTASLRLKTN